MLDELRRNYEKMKTKSLLESHTDYEFVYPFLKKCLGYDNPDRLEVQYKADPKDKPDFAILNSDKEPIIYIESKRLNASLDKHHGQIKRYFDLKQSVKFAILTNGHEYRFYTDLDNENLLDSEPFLSFNLENYTDTDSKILSKFRIENFDAIKIRELAKELSYKSKILEYLKREIFVQDSFDLVKFITKKALNSTAKSNYSIVNNILPSVLEELVEVKSTEGDFRGTSKVESPVPFVSDESEVQKTENENEVQGEAKNIFDVEDPTLHKLEYVEFEKERVDQPSFTDLYIYVVKKLFDRDKELFLNVIGGKLASIVKSRSRNESYEELSDGYFLETSKYANAKTRFKNIKKILTEFDLKDALYVKLIKPK